MIFYIVSNMTIWEKIAIFEATAKNSVLERRGVTPNIKYEKKIKNSIGKFVFSNLKNPFFGIVDLVSILVDSAERERDVQGDVARSILKLENDRSRTSLSSTDGRKGNLSH